MSVAGLCELTLETADPEALAAFYAEQLGLEVLQRQEDRIWLARGTQRSPRPLAAGGEGVRG